VLFDFLLASGKLLDLLLARGLVAVECGLGLGELLLLGGELADVLEELV
jgi:hypothetical protein